MPDKIEINPYYNFIHKVLVKTFYLKNKNNALRYLWNKLFNYSHAKYKGPINSIIHNQDVITNNGYSYPFVARMFKTFNNPLLELVNQIYNYKGKPLTVIDIGAATGDTALFLLENSDIQIEKIICIDGDDEFYNYLLNNVKKYKKVETIKCLLSDGVEQKEHQLIRTHLGTASAQGEELQTAFSLDSILNTMKNVNEIDIIKIDVDGFDGKVLTGSKNILNKYKPAIIFEWHPILYQQTSNSIYQPFDLLNESGYSKYIWFDKFGKFSHFSHSYNKTDIELLGQICLNNIHDFDWHYDVVAINNEINIPLDKLAELYYAKSKKSYH